MIEELTIRVELIQDGICVTLMAGCEDYYLPVFFHFFEEGDCIWSDIEPYLYGEAIDVDSQLDVWFGFVPLKTVDKCLIQIQNKGLLTLATR